MTRWRQRIGAERLELLLAETVEAARRGGAVEEKHLRRVTIDTTVQPKAVTHPTDSKLLHRGIEILARLARRHRIKLRQSYLRVARRARREAAQLIHSGRPRQAERHVRHLRTWLGRLLRDIGRKIAGATARTGAGSPRLRREPPRGSTRATMSPARDPFSSWAARRHRAQRTSVSYDRSQGAGHLGPLLEKQDMRKLALLAATALLVAPPAFAQTQQQRAQGAQSQTGSPPMADPAAPAAGTSATGSRAAALTAAAFARTAAMSDLY